MSKPVSADALLTRIALYAEILTKDPRSTIFVQMSDAYRKLGMSVDALRIAEEGIAKVPNFAPGYVALGKAFFQLGDVPQARKAFEDAHRIVPRDLQIAKGLALVCQSGGDLEGALALVRKALEFKPSDTSLLSLRQILEVSVDAQCVESGAPDAVQNQNQVPVNRSSVSATVFQEEDVPERVADETVSREKDDTASLKDAAPIATATLADIYIRQGLFDKALKVYQDLLRVDPNNSELLKRVENLTNRMAPLGAVGDAVVSELPEVAAKAQIIEQTVSDAGRSGSVAERMVFELERFLGGIRRRREHVC